MLYSDYSKNFITRFCYEFFHPSCKMNKNVPPSLFACIKKFLRRFFSYCRHPDFKKPPISKIIFFSTTINNNNALQPIWSKLNEKDYSLWLRDYIFAETKIVFYSFLYLTLFFKMYISLSKDDRAIVREYNYWFMNIYGYYKTIGHFLKKNKNKIKLIVMANDHSTTNQCILDNCIKYGIKTMFVQHSAVAMFSPPNRFTYSILDNIDSYKKYCDIGAVNTRAFVCGGTRFDVLYQQNYIRKYIGIAINDLDKMEKVIELCVFLIKNNVKDIILRPHPGMILGKNIEDEFEKMGVLISNSKTENCFVYLSKLKLLISNDSSIHEDALLARIPSVVYNFSDLKYMDTYGFVKSGITNYCHGFDDVLNECFTPHVVDKNLVVKKNPSCNTKYEGKVSEFIAAFINSITNRNEDEFINANFRLDEKGCFEYKLND